MPVSGEELIQMVPPDFRIAGLFRRQKLWSAIRSALLFRYRQHIRRSFGCQSTESV